MTPPTKPPGSESERCAACEGKGRLYAGFVTVLCKVCHGTGKRPDAKEERGGGSADHHRHWRGFESGR